MTTTIRRPRLLLTLLLAAAFTTLLVVGVLWAHETSPFTFSPSVTDVDDNGECRRGSFQCRWRGDCKKVGDKCYSCTEGYTYSTEMKKCYKCSKGHSLVKRSGSWQCVD